MSRGGWIPDEWQAMVLVPIFKRGTRGCAPIIRVLHRSASPVKFTLVQEEQCGFCPGCGKTDHEKAYDRVLRLRKYGVPGPAFAVLLMLYQTIVEKRELRR